eukprot:UN08805
MSGYLCRFVVVRYSFHQWRFIAYELLGKCKKSYRQT